jgi:flagellar motility protein MotE (MotC chaperone)
MVTSDARRRDLYNVLDELLGSERAETLMAYLPAYENTDLATTDDIRRVEERLHHLEDRLQRLEDRLEHRFDSIDQRLDRFFLTQSAGLIAIVGTLIAALMI